LNRATPNPPPPLAASPTSRPVESLSGLIERITFFNEEKGWAALKAKAKGQLDPVTVIGTLPSSARADWSPAYP
jgi:exodeoxyribonuclease V alpha subunit